MYEYKIIYKSLCSTVDEEFTYNIFHRIRNYKHLIEIFPIQSCILYSCNKCTLRCNISMLKIHSHYFLLFMKWQFANLSLFYRIPPSGEIFVLIVCSHLIADMSL